MLLPDLTGLLGSDQFERAHRFVVRSIVIIGGVCVAYGALMLIARPEIEAVLFKGRFAGEPMGRIGLVVWGVVTLALL